MRSSRIRRISVIFGVMALLMLSTIVVGAAPIKVGIVQLVEHLALDAAHDGFVDRLTELGYKEGTDIVYDFHSAQNDMPTAQTIAQKFAADRVDLVLAIATPAAQGAANVIRDIPILITAVTDPVDAGLVQSFDKPGTNVSGTSDLTPVELQLELLKDIVPGAKRVGIIYNSGESNSVVQVDIAKEVAPKLSIELIESTATNTSEIMQAAQSLIGRVDAIYVPTDNTAVTAIESIVQVAENAQLPLIVGEEHSVESGALATVGLDYYELGRQTADMAHRILQDGADPAEMPIEYQSETSIMLNLSAAQRMGVTIPDAILNEAGQVIE